MNNNNDLHMLSTTPLEPLVHELLAPSGYPLITAPDDSQATLLGMMPGTVALATRNLAPIGPDMMDASDDLLVISRSGAGYENVVVDAATERGIVVVNAPLLEDAAAEGTFALILALNKKLFYWHNLLVMGDWERRTLERTGDLLNATIGIVGLGRIGRAVAVRAKAFGMNMLGHDPFVSQAQVEELGVSMVALDDLLAQSDVVSLHALVTDETRHMINRDTIRKIKRGAILINFARGALVENNDVVYEALRDGQLSGVGFDVLPEEPPTDLTHPLFHHPNFVGAPHVLASTRGVEERCSRSYTNDILAVLGGQRPRFCVNPQVFDSANFRKVGTYGRHRG